MHPFSFRFPCDTNVQRRNDHTERILCRTHAQVLEHRKKLEQKRLTHEQIKETKLQLAELKGKPYEPERTEDGELVEDMLVCPPPCTRATLSLLPRRDRRAGCRRA